MNSTGENNFVETLEYRRFKEFCDALLSLLLHRAMLRIARSRQNAFGAALLTLESNPRGKIA
jgi:hypothetical protein